MSERNPKRIGGRGQEVHTPADLRTQLTRASQEALAAEAARGDRPVLQKREPVLPEFAREPNVAPSPNDRVTADGAWQNRRGGIDESTLYRDPASGRLRPYRPGEQERLEREARDREAGK